MLKLREKQLADDKNMTDMKQIGQRMRARREFLGLMQKNVASLLSVAAATYSRYESGELTLSAPDLDRTARVLGVKASYLLGEEEETETQEVVYEPIMDELRTASYSGDLDPDTVNDITDYIKMKRLQKARRRGAA